MTASVPLSSVIPCFVTVLDDNYEIRTELIVYVILDADC